MNVNINVLMDRLLTIQDNIADKNIEAASFGIGVLIGILTRNFTPPEKYSSILFSEPCKEADESV